MLGVNIQYFISQKPSSILVDLAESLMLAELLERLHSCIVEVAAALLGQVWNFGNQGIHTDHGH